MAERTRFEARLASSGSSLCTREDITEEIARPAPEENVSVAIKNHLTVTKGRACLRAQHEDLTEVKSSFGCRSGANYPCRRLCVSAARRSDKGYIAALGSNSRGFTGDSLSTQQVFDSHPHTTNASTGASLIGIEH